MVLESAFTGDTRVENEALSLISKGHSVSIICYGKTRKTKVEHYKNIKLYRLGISEFIKKSSIAALILPFYFNFWKKNILRILESESYETIHVHDLALVSVCYEISKSLKLNLVIDLHENYPVLLQMSEHTKSMAGKILCSIKKWKAYEKKYINLADHIIVVVEEARERLVKLGAEPGKIEIVSNYLKYENYRQFKRNPRKDGKITFVYIGGITYHRGLQYVLEATRLINDLSDKFYIKIIGDGSYLKSLKRLTRKFKLKNILFTGWLSEYEAFENLSDANVALIPHIKSDHTDNTIPHKLFYYMYYGIPVISSDCKPIERIVKESGSGIIFPSGDAKSLSQIMRSFISDPHMADNYSESRNYVKEKYNWNQEAKKLLSLYDKL